MHTQAILEAIIKKTQRVPVEMSTGYDSRDLVMVIAKALRADGALLSRDLYNTLSQAEPQEVSRVGALICMTVSKMLGGHVRHNVYFKSFATHHAVPSTEEFWLAEIARLIFTGRTKYGNYQHSYEDMVNRCEQFVQEAGLNRKPIVLQKGDNYMAEAHNLYCSLAESTIPLNEEDCELLAGLALNCIEMPLPQDITMRENLSVINAVRLQHAKDISVGTLTDVLRLACRLSDGDCSLSTQTKFRSFSRRLRRKLMEVLEGLVKANEKRLVDVVQYTERWKRLGERLHSREYRNLANAQRVFEVARNPKLVTTNVSLIERAFSEDNHQEVMALLAKQPGMLFRSLDRVIRTIGKDDTGDLLDYVRDSVSRVSGKVILSLIEHLQNRLEVAEGDFRIFINKKGTSHVSEESRSALDSDVVQQVLEVLRAEIVRRIPQVEHFTMNEDMRSVAVPFSAKGQSDGFAVMPRGSITKVENGILRFFIYWKERSQTTDYDLSVLMLGDDFTPAEQVSWTNLSGIGAIHSGDITSAPNGASEFIDIDLKKVKARYVIPMVHLYAGESFMEVEESLFGYMERTYEQMGKPFEAQTVRTKFELRDSGRVALPLAFMRADDGTWSAKWMNLYLQGTPNFNMVEDRASAASLQVKAIIQRKYLYFADYADLIAQKANSFVSCEGNDKVTQGSYLGLQAPEYCDPSVDVTTLGSISKMIPA